MKRYWIPAATSLFLACGTARAATEVDARVDLGYDSNPFHLNSSVDTRAGAFTDLEASFDARAAGTGKLGFDAGAALRKFGSDMDDGDETRLFARVYGATDPKAPGHAFEWALRYRVADSTFVSHFTGQPATSGGADISDRYDSGTLDASGAWRLPQGEYGSISFKGSIESKDYRKDYESLGLDRLDYVEFGIEPVYDVDGGADEFRLGLPLARRQYRDRRAEDATGAPLPGTDLEYTYYGVDARYRHDLSEPSRVEFTGGYEIRADNSAGYRDRKRWNAGVEWSYRLAPRNRLSAGFEWSSRTLDRPQTGAIVGDETPDKDGYTLQLKYAQPVPGVADKDFSLFAQAQWESFDNSVDPRFSYDRLEAFAGVRKVF